MIPSLAVELTQQTRRVITHTRSAKSQCSCLYWDVLWLEKGILDVYL